MQNFEYNNDRFTEQPILKSNKGLRQIILSTEAECFTLEVPKTINGGQFSILLNELIKFMPNIENVVALMRDMCEKINGSILLCDMKQGYIWDDNKKYKFRDDQWNDGMSFEKWCSQEQIAKEYYAKRRKRSIQKSEEYIIPLKDLFGEANERNKKV